MQIEAIIFLLLLIVAFGGAMAWLWYKDQARQSALASLAARRGWTLRRTLPMGQGIVTRLFPDGDKSWSLTLTQPQNDAGNSAVRTMEWHDSETVHGPGTVAVGPAMDSHTGALAGQMLASLDGPMGRGLMETVFGAGTVDLAGLRPIWGNANGLTVLASEGAETGLDLQAVEAAMADWASSQSGKLAQPILVAGPQGLRLRLRDIPDDPDTIADFVDFALNLRGRLAPKHL